jgi:tRNA(fMet)-specific endonuclease VapC
VRSNRAEPRWVLDTNAIIHLVRGRDRLLVKNVRKHPVAELAITDVTLAELEYGSLKSPVPERHRTRWRQVVQVLTALPFDEHAALQHARIRLALRQTPIGERDLMIAAIACAHGLPLVTGNLGEFCRVPGLEVEDWSKE